MDHSPEAVAILDAGGQYSKVIDRKNCEFTLRSYPWIPAQICSNKEHLNPLSLQACFASHFRHSPLTGSPDSVYASSIKYDPKIFDIGVPVLGICFGMQMIAYCTGGKVEKQLEREDGQYAIPVSTESPLFYKMEPTQKVLLTHSDSVTAVGDDYEIIANSGDLISAISNKTKKIYGVQFHPEVDLTENGQQILHNFLFHISGLTGDFSPKSRHDNALREIISTVGGRKVLMMASGGVDSTVCCALLNEALGADRVIALHIDNGFMRKNESAKVAEALKNIGLKLNVVDASQEFYQAKTSIDNGSVLEETMQLNETWNPEHKRKIIGNTFVKIAQREIERLGLDPKEVFLAQGTLRPDMIESGSLDVSKHAAVIKTHHNDTALVRELRALGRVIEPLKDYHKDEVRELGKDLGLPSSIVSRHPFPGPGLAVRILCAQKPLIDCTFEDTNVLLNQITTGNRQDDMEESITKALRNDEILTLQQIRTENNIVATLLPFNTVGVQGDGRTYSYPCLLTVKNSHPIWEHLFALARFIPRICHNINRIIYMFGEAIPGPITNIVPTLCTPDVISTLQEADDIVTNILTDTDQLKRVAQAPVILFPFGTANERSIAFRPIITTDFMTGKAAVPGKDLTTESILEMAQKVTELKGVCRFAYDLTSKPPGTTEWE